MEQAMRKIAIDQYRDLLKAKQQELLRDFQTRDRLTIEKTPEMEEEAQMAAEQELAVVTRNQAANMLRQIRAALDRITTGDYGTCLSCGEEIEVRRLEALPWAAFCVRCQETLDREQKGTATQPPQLVAREALRWRSAA